MKEIVHAMPKGMFEYAFRIYSEECFRYITPEMSETVMKITLFQRAVEKIAKDLSEVMQELERFADAGARGSYLRGDWNIEIVDSRMGDIYRFDAKRHGNIFLGKTVQRTSLGILQFMVQSEVSWLADNCDYSQVIKKAKEVPIFRWEDEEGV